MKLPFTFLRRCPQHLRGRSAIGTRSSCSFSSICSKNAKSRSIRFSSSHISAHTTSPRSLFSQPTCTKKTCLAPNSNHVRMYKSLCSSRNPPKEPQYADIAIVGSGMVGNSFAVALQANPSTRHLRLAVIESHPIDFSPSSQNPVPDPRVISLNMKTIRFLTRKNEDKGKTEIGVWDKIEGTGRVAPFNKLQVFESSSDRVLKFQNTNHAHHSRNMGAVIENTVLQQVLLQSLEPHSPDHVKFFAPAVVSKIEVPKKSHEEQLAKIHFEDETCVAAKLVVGADGRTSAVRTSLGFETVGWSYDQKAVGAVVEHASPNTTSFQRFLPTGPIALLPMFGNYSNVVWSTNFHQAEALMQMDNEAFLRELRRAYLGPLHSASPFSVFPDFFSSHPEVPDFPELLRVVGSRGTFPLQMRTTTSYAKPRAILIGDAAHTIHPLAGQGGNLGFSDVSALVDTIASGVDSGQDIGSLHLLQRYELQRFAQNGQMIFAVDFLKRFYGSSSIPLMAARQVGLMLTDNIPILKDRFVEFAING